jgi:hypothetical protein
MDKTNKMGSFFALFSIAAFLLVVAMMFLGAF